MKTVSTAPAGRSSPARAAVAPDEPRALADNRKATFDYHIDRRIEAGIALRGTEIKSVRAGTANLRDGYARVDKGQVWLRNVHIAPWANALEQHEPTRPRKLLLHKDEIVVLAGEVSQKGYTLVPLRIYVKNGVAKVELGLARGKKRFDKRQTIKERQHTREMDAAIRQRVGRR
ncbi:MAG: SsrA-binding protein SmpB [Chloroflexota bacterium]|nr:SsrA-binding protein SmpB [Chloroflexota bacterium]